LEKKEFPFFKKFETLNLVCCQIPEQNITKKAVKNVGNDLEL